METLEDIGEIALLQRLKPYLDNPYLPHDDASAFLSSHNTLLLTNVDGFVKSSDMLPGMNYTQVGYKAAVMAVSDIIVKGISPAFLLASFSVPKTMLWTDLLQVIKGLTSFTRKYSIKFLGGDFNSTIRDEVFDIIVTGTGAPSSLIPRKGGSIGDLVVTKPEFGWTTLAYDYLLNHAPIHNTSILKEALTWAYTPPYNPLNELRLQKQLSPVASIDSSDGLVRSLYELISINHFGINLHEIPLPSSLRSYLESYHLPMTDYAFYGGEEFIPIYIVPKEQRDSIPSPYMVIGEVIEEEGLFSSILEPKTFVPNRGWQHFQNK